MLPAEVQAVRSVLWTALRGRFLVVLTDDTPGPTSRFGGEWEVLSASRLLSSNPEDRARTLSRVLDEFLASMGGERPGGGVALRGTLANDPDAVPTGIRAEATPIGDVAIRLRLACTFHPLSLESARAHARELLRVSL